MTAPEVPQVATSAVQTCVTGPPIIRRFGWEVLADETVDVAVEDALGVADFEVGAVVPDHRVGLGT